jgi:cytochrome c
MKTFCLILAGGMLAIAGAAHAGGDPVKGEAVFRKCGACHSTADGANRVGPSLHGIVGRPVATAPNYSYSAAMKAFGADGKVWSEDMLTTYLAAPRDVVEGTRMTFAGLKKPQDIANVIAYLKNPDAVPSGW